MKYTVKDGTQPGDQVSFKSRGITDKNTPSIRGDHTVRFVVEIPTKLSEEQKRLLGRSPDILDMLIMGMVYHVMPQYTGGRGKVKQLSNTMT